ncbi:hypothetical protein [Methanohalobium sp.]|uniref:hypothetical protein n=1 Tax=Methanohalobium sp. TaxID=2837493 RepID=UPI0025F52BFC|nr:hypothetical protein [Methanohalobium sp.]
MKLVRNGKTVTTASDDNDIFYEIESGHNYKIITGNKFNSKKITFNTDKIVDFASNTDKDSGNELI